MTTTAPHNQPRPQAGRAFPCAAAALAAALLPMLAGLTLLASARVRGRAVTLACSDRLDPEEAKRIGRVWGIGLVVIGGLQALGSLALGLSITDPGAVLVRTLFALAGESLLVFATSRPEA